MAGSGLTDPRPLSPHLQVWKFHATMFASIIHRATGVAMYFGAFLITGWVVALASGEEAYAIADTVINHPIGQVILFLWAVATMFHLMNGIKYLLWDGPKFGFTPGVASRFAIFNFAFSILAAAGLYAYATMVA